MFAPPVLVDPKSTRTVEPGLCSTRVGDCAIVIWFGALVSTPHGLPPLRDLSRFLTLTWSTAS
jgi:hypothetical protein